MLDQAALNRLCGVLDILAGIARDMDPRRLPDLIARLPPVPSAAAPEPLAAAATFTEKACAGLRAAPDADNPMIQALRALRQYNRALEELASLADREPGVSSYFLEPAVRDVRSLPERPHPDSGIFHSANQTSERGGFSVYVPPWYDPVKPAPVLMALHGGSGHGRLFLWNWLTEARSRDLIIIAPTAIGSTWSLMDPEIDSTNLGNILNHVQSRWATDPKHRLLTGMSDGGTFTLLAGLADDSPFTHLAPVAPSFHPLLLSMTSPERLSRLPIHLTHGARDWMFPVDRARMAHRMLQAAGAAITYREIADLSHAYPRDGQQAVVDWWLTTR